MLEQHYIDARESAGGPARRCRSPRTSASPATQGPAPYFANYVKQQLVDALRRAAACSAAGCRSRRRSTSGCRSSRAQAIDEVAAEPDRAAGRARRASTRTRARCSRWSAAQLPREPVQPRRRRASASPARVQAVRARDRARDGISPQTTLRLAADRRSTPAAASGSVAQLRAHVPRADRPRRRRSTYSDNTVFAQLTQLVGPRTSPHGRSELGITSPLQPYFSIGLGARARQPARDGARLRDVRERRLPDRRLDLRQRAARDRRAIEKSTSKTSTTTRRAQRSRARQPDDAAIVDQLLQGVVRYGTGTARAAARTARSPARRARPRTTATPGSSGSRRSSSTAVWVGYPNKLIPMPTEFHGDAVAGGTFPALIWKASWRRRSPYLQDDRTTFPSADRTRTRRRRGSSTATARSSSTTATAATRSTLVFFSGRGPAQTADCKPNEVEVPRRRRRHARRGARRASPAQPLTPDVVYKPARPGSGSTSSSASSRARARSRRTTR